jgi:hypothetical protein
MDYRESSDDPPEIDGLGAATGPACGHRGVRRIRLRSSYTIAAMLRQRVADRTDPGVSPLWSDGATWIFTACSRCADSARRRIRRGPAIVVDLDAHRRRKDWLPEHPRRDRPVA